jgi:hypothetical protein
MCGNILVRSQGTDHIHNGPFTFQIQHGNVEIETDARIFGSIKSKVSFNSWFTNEYQDSIGIQHCIGIGSNSEGEKLRLLAKRKKIEESIEFTFSVIVSHPLQKKHQQYPSEMMNGMQTALALGNLPW